MKDSFSTDESQANSILMIYFLVKQNIIRSW